MFPAPPRPPSGGWAAAPGPANLAASLPERAGQAEGGARCQSTDEKRLEG